MSTVIAKIPQFLMNTAINSDTPQKKIASLFLDLVVTGKVAEAYDTYVHPNFRHHNQYYKGDRATLMAGMEESNVNFPHKVLEVKKILEDADLVMTFSSVKMTTDMPEVAVMHLFRFEDGKIMELWDIGQQLSEDSQNENGMF